MKKLTTSRPLHSNYLNSVFGSNNNYLPAICLLRWRTCVRPSTTISECRTPNHASKEQPHMSRRRRRLQDVLPPVEQTIDECWDCRVDFQLATRPVAHEGCENDSYDASLFSIPVCRMYQQPCKSRTPMALHIGTHNKGQLWNPPVQPPLYGASAVREETVRGFCEKLFAHKSDLDEHLHLKPARRRRFKHPSCPTWK
ncbi:hypothetical protein V5799_020272 [Amblyomma americanum]|uniref:Uncharacterized protein n=1 Tax=Amblyomma americanum TaxID=6943 RepID=A0AAQ4EUD1_AMBAM